ncbi:unnamed protein product [Leuciscus chuanchicus]
MASQQRSYRKSVHPCPRYIPDGDSHNLCVSCLGAGHARSALEGVECEHCERLPLSTLRSRLALFNQSGQLCAPRGAGPAVAEPNWRLHSWGSQVDLGEGFETALTLSQPSSPSSSAHVRDTEARSAASSASNEGLTLGLSSSEEVDVLSIEGYMAADQAGACLHTMAILQAYQADLLGDLDKGENIDIEDIKELRRATDLSLRATKEAARAIGCSMAALAATERHLWLNLSGIKERDRAFLLDAPLAPPGLFGDAVSSVVERFQEAKKQAAAFQKFIPRLKKSHGAAAKGQPQPSVVQVYGADRNSSWVKKCSGVACLVKDSTQRSYFIRVFDIKEGKILFDQDLISTFTINCSRPDFITFAGHAFQFGLNFDSEEEAKRFSSAANDLLVRKWRKSALEADEGMAYSEQEASRAEPTVQGARAEPAVQGPRAVLEVQC